ncbi:MAG TPA: hypothetical protein VL752_08065 [Acidisoma sp.]|uniref:hypothetical protein n=1 Tax=Acidisoma sp. TaxID=1872115 RepID=UPI002D01082B|nr:hypothetical protein [Acidisoma sp.]HTI00886.1 hypothetical protein [Acidisoma sp.]
MTPDSGPDRADPDADLWPGADGNRIDCREKLRTLRENHAEVTQALRDCFEDAVLMGVDEAAMRQLLHAMVDALRDPRAGRRQDA